ncbi:retrovirus-related pol polyprotein from transposon TNT 1-94 [Tanacetum coccineum]
MIPRTGDPDCEVPVAETFHEQTDDELTEKEVKQMEADDQAIQIILMGLPEDIYAAATLFNEWERFTYTGGELIESYYHHFSKLMNDFKRNKHFPEKIFSNLKFLNNLQPEWRRHVTIVHQTKDLHEVDYTQLYDFLKYNQSENVGNQNGLIVVPRIANPNANQNENGNVVAAWAEGNGNRNNGNHIRCYNCRGLGYLARNCIVRPRKREAAYLQTQLLIAQKEEAGIQLQAEEFDFMAATRDLEDIKEVNANCILMANLQQASTSGTQTDNAPVYDSDGSAEVHHYDNCYNNEIFNMFTQEEQYTELLEPIPKPHQVQQNDSNIISAVSNVEQCGGTVEQNLGTIEETHALYDTLYNNLAIEVEKVNTVNRKMKETNAELRKCFEINKEKYNKLERCYQKSVYQEQCLTKKINALHLSSAKTITTLNEEIANLNNQLSKEKSTVSSLQEEKEKLKSDFKIREKMAMGYQDPFYLKQAQQKQQSLYNGKILLEKPDPPAGYDLE